MPLELLERAVPGGVTRRRSARLAKAHDASHYLLVPEVVVTAADTGQVVELVRACAALGQPLTFRSGGTSLSGQAGTRGVLVDTRRHFRDITALDGGARVRVQPGATVRAVNARLAPFGTRLGPDPASEAACTIGGVIANNSSGMACGTELNTYRTLESMVLVLPSGTVLDTAAADADARFAALEPELHSGLLRLRDRVRSAPSSVTTIRRLFAMKNTMGYGVNAFLDHERAVDILAHLVVGSEGTLGFVAEATFRTIPVRRHAATGLLIFRDLHGATTALPELVAAGFATVELMDATSLRVCQRDPQAVVELVDLSVDAHAALLVEYQETGTGSLTERVDASAGLFAGLPLAAPARLTTVASARAALWHLRKGLYATVAGNRPPGTTALLEDIAVPVPRLAEVCAGLHALFTRHAYEESVIFGHAKDGNVHFLLNERFDAPGGVDRYLAFTDDMVDLVLDAGGTLKAEHGTGRIMAPFVRRQYGDELYDVMVQVKRLCDPGGIMNPGVLISEDPQAHVSDLKPSVTVEEEVDRCVECGYCEPVCPSKDLTLTPRTRIAVRREIARARERGDLALVQELEEDYRYEGVETCAADGMCQTACPVLIDTGSLVKRLRAEEQPRSTRAVWRYAARHWQIATRAAAAALTVGSSVPARIPARATAVGRRLLGPDVVPAWAPDLPRGGTRRGRTTAATVSPPVAVHFPSCMGAIFAPTDRAVGTGAAAAFAALCDRAGVGLRIPAGIDALCCGTPWKSKGLTDGYALMRDRVVSALWDATEHGRLPVVCEAASCTEGLELMLAAEGRSGPRVVDAVVFTAEEILPKTMPPTRVASAVLHPTCSTQRRGTSDALATIAGSLADRVVVPQDWGCCAFAGDRGMLHPELTASATAREATEVVKEHHDLYLSDNRTCEIGMSRATGRRYEHVLEAFERATRPANPS